LLPALFVSLLPLVSSAQKAAPAAKIVPPPATPSFSDQALVFERYDTTYRMHADGTGERDIHVVVRVQSQGAAQQFGVLTLSYASANETPTIQLVRVHKPDGTTVDTPPTDAMDMPSAVTREAPLYSNLKEKHLPVRSLSVGDTLEYEARFAIDKAEAPAQFWGAHHFTVPGSVIVRNETLTLEIPANKYVQVWRPNHKPAVSQHDGLRTYVWTVPQLIPLPNPTPTMPLNPLRPKIPTRTPTAASFPPSPGPPSTPGPKSATGTALSPSASRSPTTPSAPAPTI
jgi:hypothetical protein